MKTLRDLTILSILIFLTWQCSKPDCEKYCSELTEHEKQLDPYRQYDTIYFTDNKDTFNIICLSKEYYQDVDIYSDNYYYDKCDGGQRTYYWEQSSKFYTDIPYTDSTLLQLEINIRTNYDYENVITFELYDNNYSSYNEKYSFSTIPNNSERFYKNTDSYPLLPPKYFQCDLTFLDKITLKGHLFNNVHILYGDIQNFDSVYYNSECGFIRMVRDTIKLNIMNKP